MAGPFPPRTYSSGNLWATENLAVSGSLLFDYLIYSIYFSFTVGGVRYEIESIVTFQIQIANYQ